MRSIILHGALIGSGAAFWSLIMFLLGWDSSPLMRNLSFLSILILALGIYSGMNKKRNSLVGGYANFFDGVKTGLGITIIAAFINGFYAYLYVLNVNPGLAESVIVEKTAMLSKIGIAADKIEHHAQWLRKEYSPVGQMIFNGGGFLVLGLVFSALYSFFMFEKKLEEQM